MLAEQTGKSCVRQQEDVVSEQNPETDRKQRVVQVVRQIRKEKQGTLFRCSHTNTHKSHATIRHMNRKILWLESRNYIFFHVHITIQRSKTFTSGSENDDEIRVHRVNDRNNSKGTTRSYHSVGNLNSLDMDQSPRLTADKRHSLIDSSAGSTTEGDSSQKSHKSTVYLHATTGMYIHWISTLVIYFVCV